MLHADWRGKQIMGKRRSLTQRAAEGLSENCRAIRLHSNLAFTQFINKLFCERKEARLIVLNSSAKSTLTKANFSIKDLLEKETINSALASFSIFKNLLGTHKLKDRPNSTEYLEREKTSNLTKSLKEVPGQKNANI